MAGAPQPSRPSGFFSRAAELAAVEQRMRAAAAGRGGTLVICGEAGIGKTELLERVLERADGLRLVRAVGREFESELAYTGLHELCRPLLTRLKTLPAPQRTAVEVAFALRDGATPDHFRLGLAVLGLLSAAAREQPIVCAVDDAQWLDHASAQVLAFVARRVEHDPVMFLFAVRETAEPALLDGLPTLTLTGLGNEDSLALLASQLHAPLDERIRDQIVAEARGNPLALLELPRRVRSAELAGGFGLPKALPVPVRIEAGYRERLTVLPEDTQRLLLLAAGEPLGDPVLLWRAAEGLGIGAGAAAPAEAAQLLDIGVRVRFRHPLVRSAVYDAATPDDRRGVHRALAEATDPRTDPDRRAWHRAQSVLGPDEDIAAELESAAVRASTRGGMAAAAGFLERATALTPDPARRAERALNAARFNHWAGAHEAATELLATARTGPLDGLQRALAEVLTAQISVDTGAKDPAPLLDAARNVEVHEPLMARDVYVEALLVAMRAGRLGAEDLLVDTAHEVAKSLDAAPLTPAPRADRLLRALIRRETDGYAAAVPAMRDAIDTFLTAAKAPNPRSRWLSIVTGVAIDLWDLENWRVIAEHHVRITRRKGALITLPSGLHLLAAAHLVAGEFQDAATLVAEANMIDPTGNSAGPPFGDLALRAWRGDEEGVAALAERVTELAHESGEGHFLTVLDGTQAVLYNGVGRYDAAFECAARACRHDELAFSALNPTEFVEAAARSGRHRQAGPVLAEFIHKTDASGTDLAIGLQLHARALLTDGADAEDLYEQSIHRLTQTHAVAYLGRTHLVYGEWLRRETRRAAARTQLRIAYELLSAIGAAGFAARAARELSACGERPLGQVYRPATKPFDLLTPQELQIARLVAAGATSKAAASQLFLSPRTVHAHLRSIFKKLGITSRRQLHDLQLDPPEHPTDSASGVKRGVRDDRDTSGKA